MSDECLFIYFIVCFQGERVFPPQSGLTYSTWFCVDKFSSANTDAHPVRLLTIVRNLQGRDENLICLSVSLVSKDRALIVSTLESYMPNASEFMVFLFQLDERSFINENFENLSKFAANLDNHQRRERCAYAQKLT